jgi:hypothetical protein
MAVNAGTVARILASLLLVLGIAACATAPPPPTAEAYKSLWQQTLHSGDKQSTLALIHGHGFTREVTGNELYEYAYKNILILECDEYYTLFKFELDDVEMQGRFYRSLDVKTGLKKNWWKYEESISYPAYQGHEPHYLVRLFENPATGERLVWEFNMSRGITTGVSVQPDQQFAADLWDR